MAKPIKTLELHYQMIQFLIIINTVFQSSNTFGIVICLENKCTLSVPTSELLIINGKNSKKTTRRATSAIWRIFAELNNPKRTLSKTNLTSMEESMFLLCF